MAFLAGTLPAGVIVERGTSTVVGPGADGRLMYSKDKQGNRLPDFSYVGYHSGERAIPGVPVVAELSPAEGDNTTAIQTAIDELGARPAGEDGFRGALLLKRGVYRVEGVLRVGQSGIVLRGEGNGPDGTVLVAAGYGEGKFKRTLITVGNGNRIKLVDESRREIVDDYVPVGAHSFEVESAEGYAEGDRIVVHRPATEEWIRSIGCDRLKPRWTGIRDVRWEKDGPEPGLYYQRGGSSHVQRIPKKADETWELFKERVPISRDGTKLDVTRQWEAGHYHFYFERRITDIDGNRITIDAPIVHPLDEQYGGGAIVHYETPGRVYEVGIENLRLVSEFAKPVEGHPYGDPSQTGRAEKHGWNAIKLHRNSENTWVKNVTGNYFGWSVVSASGVRATVQDCVSLGHASRITGGRRYPFMIDGQLNLMQRCLTFEGRHEFVAQARTAGPNVFVDCIGRNSKSSTGPHHRYSIGTLFDNVRSERAMESRFRGSSGTGHGWAGTQTCFYNCIAPGFNVDAPPGGISWVIGSGSEFSEETRVDPPSLYYRQVEERLGEAAVQRQCSPEQRRQVGRYLWVDDRLATEKGEGLWR